MNKKKENNYGDIPYVDAADPDSSIGNGAHDIIAPQQDINDFNNVAISHDEEANYQQIDSNKNNKNNINNNASPISDDKLEESLSVDPALLNNNNNNAHNAHSAPPAPPPPSEPIPEDVLKRHKYKSKDILFSPKGNHHLSNSKEPDFNRRSTFAQGINNKKKNESLEMQKMKYKPRMSQIDRNQAMSFVD